MRTILMLAALSVLLSFSSRAEERPQSELVTIGEDGRLVYHPWSDRGDIIPDFSTCGYQGGGVAIPDVPVRKTIRPLEGDNREHIQSAIDEVSALPLGPDGIRGAVLLTRGVYPVEGGLLVRASGVVLRGEGDGEDGTVLVATLRKKHTLIRIAGEGSMTPVEASRSEVVDDYVPVGATRFRVEDAAALAPGQHVIVHRPATAEWISTLKMDRIPERRNQRLTQWKPSSYHLRFERVITAVDGQHVTVDAPLVNALQKEFGGGSVYRYDWPGRIRQVGVENLRGVSEFDRSTEDSRRKGEYVDEDHGWNFISVDRAADGWVRKVTSVHFGYSCVNISSRSSQFTVLESACLDPVSKIAGGRRYSFALAGQRNLVKDCRTRGGRHDFVMHARVPGPNAFVNCRAERAYSDSGPHHRWATGTLYDNVVIEGNSLDVEDRQWSGTGHGWAGAVMVFWNCVADAIRCQKPPTSQNFAIGCKGRKATGHYVKDHPDGWWESHGTHVAPRSLFEAQLRDRLGQ